MQTSIFKSVKFLRLFTAFLFAAIQVHSATTGFLRAQDKFVGNDTGLVQLRGLGLGGWMLQEGYMIGTGGFAGTQHEVQARIESVVGTAKMEAFYQSWRDNFVTRQDIDSLAAWGFNAIRLPMHWNLYMEPGLPIRWKDEGFRRTDSLLGWCKANRIWMILDLHAAPGGQGRDVNISDRDSTAPSLWDNADNRTMSVELWRKLADRYKDEPWIGGYDLLNETNWAFDGANKNGCDETQNGPLWQLQKDMTQAIRSVDNQHLVIIEGNCWGGNYAGMTPWDKNMAISFHKYWNSPDVGTVNPYFALRDQFHTPIWLGESGENSNEWFRQTIKMLEKEKIGWSWWPLKKIENVVSPASISTTPGWEAFVAWGNGGTKPSASLLEQGLVELAENLRLSKCTIHRDVMDAMFRQVQSDLPKPWRDIHVPGKFGAEEYDLGGDGIAYHDANSMNVGIKDQGTWNNGWIYRNDGVDIQWSNEEKAWNVGWMEVGEWTNYTVTADTSAQVLLLARTAGPGGKLELLVDSTVATTLEATPSAGWNTWTDSRSGIFNLTRGTHALRLRTTQGGSNLGGLRTVVATDSCVNSGKCQTVSARYPAPKATATLAVWSRAGIQSMSDLPLAIRVFDSRGQTLVSRILPPNSLLPAMEIPGRGIRFLSLGGNHPVIVQP
jgi:endoglucanase